MTTSAGTTHVGQTPTVTVAGHVATPPVAGAARFGVAVTAAIAGAGQTPHAISGTALADGPWFATVPADSRTHVLDATVATTATAIAIQTDPTRVLAMLLLHHPDGARSFMSPVPRRAWTATHGH